MKIEKVHSLLVAERVLALLTKMIEAADPLPSWGEFQIEPVAKIKAYQNGREQGFTVWVYASPVGGIPIDRGVTFSECRNSDQIVVYPNNAANQGLSSLAYCGASFVGEGLDVVAALRCFCWLFFGDWDASIDIPEQMAAQWKARWPDHCPSCLGAGGHSLTTPETQSPPDEIWRECPECAGRGACPRCGAMLGFDKFGAVVSTGSIPCPDCGWEADRPDVCPEVPS